jgi:hypothetical protein
MSQLAESRAADASGAPPRLPDDPSVADEHDSGIGGEELADAALGRAMVFGLTGGTLGMTAITIVMCLIAGADFGTAVAISIVPGLVAGLFLGGTIWMGSEVSKLEGHAPSFAPGEIRGR